MGDSNYGFMPAVQSDTGADDADKTFTVPTNRLWTIKAIHINFTSTSSTGVAGSTGDRRLEVQLQSSSTGTVNLAQITAGVVQATDLVRNYTFAPGLVRETAFVGTTLMSTLPEITLTARQKIRIFDANAVRSTADDMVVRVLVMEKEV